jgi:hypothetical protein
VAGRQNRNRHGLRDGQRAESSGFPGSHNLAVRFGGRGRGTVGVQPVHGYRRTDRERPGRGLSDHAERDAFLTEREVRLLRQSCRNRPTQPPPGAREAPAQTRPPADRVGLRHPQRPIDLELHGGRSIDGVGARVGQRLLALTGAIWHNRATGQPATRSLIAYDR